MSTLAPFGFQAGQSRRSVNEYYVPASDTSTLAVGDPVKTNGNVFVGRLPDSRQSSGMLHVTKAASGDSVRGVIVGIVAGPGDNSAQSIPGTKQRAYTVLVNDNPQALWDVQADNTAPLSAMAGMYAAYTVGAPLGSASSTVVDSSSIGATVNDLLIAEVLRNDGANSLLRVAFVQHEMAAAGGSPQIGAQIQSLVSSAGISARLRGGAAAVLAGDTSWIIPTHLPILSPERHAALATQVLGNITMSYSATGGERTSSTIKFVASAAEATSRQWRIALPVSAEYGTTAKASGRLHIRVKCDDWSQVKRLYVGLTEQGGTTHYRYFKVIESNKSRYGMHNPASAAAWNGQWRTLVECSDKQQVQVGSPQPWGADSRYYTTDGVVISLLANGAFTLEIDRIYSPDWPIGAFVAIGDGCYKSFRDTVVPAFNARGWKLGVSGNKVDGSTSGVTTYPTLSDLAAMAAQGHDAFMHGHYLSGATPTAMGGSVTDAEVREIMGAGRAAIAAALGGLGARGMRWHQWLTNTGKYNGAAMDSILKSLGVNAARGQCSDAEFGVDPYVSTYYTTFSADTRPSNYTGGNAAGWVSQQGRFNREYEEWWSDYNGTVEDHDTYDGGILQKVVGYAATAGDVALTYTHNVLPRSLLESPSYDAGTTLFADLVADLDTKQSAGQLIVLSPTQLEMLTYWREGDVYLRWDGEWVSRSTGAIAF